MAIIACGICECQSSGGRSRTGRFSLSSGRSDWAPIRSLGVGRSPRHCLPRLRLATRILNDPMVLKPAPAVPAHSRYNGRMDLFARAGQDRLKTASDLWRRACGRARWTSTSARNISSGRAGCCAAPFRPTSSPRSSSTAHPAPARRRWRWSSPTARQSHFITINAVLAGVKEIREAIAEAAGAARSLRPAHHALRGRGPPLEQGPAGRPAAPCRKRHHHPHRGDDGKPVL